MGLDVSFPLEEAQEAGLRIRPYHDDEGTLYHVVDIPGCFDEDGWQVCTSIDLWKGRGTVRANKWGRIYAPLTSWLQNHGIEWREF